MAIPDILPGMAIVVKVYHLNGSCLTFCTMAILPEKLRMAIIFTHQDRVSHYNKLT